MTGIYGWLIVNRFLHTDKFCELYGWFASSAEQYGVELDVLTNDELCCSLTDESAIPLVNGAPAGRLPDFVLFYDKDIRLAEQLERCGLKLYNSARAIELCDDKSLMHSRLAGLVPMPQTYSAPFTYENIGYCNTEFVDTMFTLLGAPVVVKEVYGSFGQQVYLCGTPDEARELLARIGGKKVIFQKFIASSFGRDLRLNVVGGRVVAAMLRYNEHGDFRANITNGGSMQPHTPTPEEEELAVRTAVLLGLDFCGVDLLFGEDGGPLLCEVNSNAHFKSIYQCTGVNAAELIMAHILSDVRYNAEHSES